MKELAKTEQQSITKGEAAAIDRLLDESNFGSIPAGPVERIQEFINDPNPNKVDLRIGIYQDETGKTPRLEVVRAVEADLQREQHTSTMPPTAGDALYNTEIEKLIFGEDCAALKEERIVTVQTVGATSGLRCGAEFLKEFFPAAKVYISSPSWADHQRIFSKSGFEVDCYPYYDSASQALNFWGMKKFLASLDSKSIVVLQVNHNPTATDLSKEEWKELIGVLKKAPIIPFIDFPYQGLVQGLDEDAWAIRELTKEGIHFLVSTSSCKNFSLYEGRIGALSIVTKNQAEAANVLSQVKTHVRMTFGSAPALPAKIIGKILSDPLLKGQWEKEVEKMRSRIMTMRESFVQALEERGLGERFGHLRKQHGIFAFTGLSREESKSLREDHSVYLLSNGRICIASLTGKNTPYIADSIAKVVMGV